MVFVGRPVLWGLAFGGTAGVDLTLKMLREELDRALALSGCANLEDVKRDLILAPKSAL